jgi:hypothetical protein
MESNSEIDSMLAMWTAVEMEQNSAVDSNSEKRMGVEKV